MDHYCSTCNKPCSAREHWVAAATGQLRRSWLFTDTVGGANASANLYSLIEAAKANYIKPYRYLVALFKRLLLAQSVDDYEALLPWNIDLGTS